MDNGELTLNIKNVFRGYQGDYKRVLCVCTAGLLRSATAAVVLSQEPFNFNTRAVGSDPYYALIPITHSLIVWADEIVFMSEEHVALTKNIDIYGELASVPYHVLNIPDDFHYRSPELVAMIKERYCTVTGFQI